MHWRPSIERRRNGICRIIVKRLLTNCSTKILYFTRMFSSDILRSVHKLRCVISYCIRVRDRHLSTFELIYSSHMWIQNIFSCGKHRTTMQIGLLHNSEFTGYLEDSKKHQDTFVHIRKSHVRVKKLGVQETDFFCFTHSTGTEFFFRCRITNWWNSSFRCWKICHHTKSKIKYEETRHVIQHQTSTPKTKPRFQPSTTILILVMLLVFRRTSSLLNSVRCCTFLKTTRQM